MLTSNMLFSEKNDAHQITENSVFAIPEMFPKLIKMCLDKVSIILSDLLLFCYYSHTLMFHDVSTVPVMLQTGSNLRIIMSLFTCQGHKCIF